PLASCQAPVAAVREEELRVAGRAEVGPLDALTARFSERPLDRGPKVELAAADDVGAERLPERLRHVLPHLVAARPDRGADGRCHAIVARSGLAPASAETRLRFSTTFAGSSSVRMPRFSDANGPSLTPPTRVVKATWYGPPASQRITG